MFKSLAVSLLAIPVTADPAFRMLAAERTAACDAAYNAAVFTSSNYTSACQDASGKPLVNGTCPAKCEDLFKGVATSCKGKLIRSGSIDEPFALAANMGGLNVFIDSKSVCKDAPYKVALASSPTCEEAFALTTNMLVFTCGKDETCSDLCKSAIAKIGTTCSGPDDKFSTGTTASQAFDGISLLDHSCKSYIEENPPFKKSMSDESSSSVLTVSSLGFAAVAVIAARLQ